MSRDAEFKALAEKHTLPEPGWDPTDEELAELLWGPQPDRGAVNRMEKLVKVDPAEECAIAGPPVRMTHTEAIQLLRDVLCPSCYEKVFSTITARKKGDALEKAVNRAQVRTPE